MYDPPEIPQDLRSLVARLRGPGGCPWDLAQDHRSLMPHLLEETYELLEALEEGRDEAILEELGDVWLQVVFHARIAEQESRFDLSDVERHVVQKLIGRHPHVFGSQPAGNPAEAYARWSAQKDAERAQRGVDESRLAGVPRALPALARAAKISTRAAQAGFEWPRLEQVRAKLDEELRELDEAVAEADRAHIEEELGDVLYVLANLARRLQIDPEQALQGTNRKFDRRFRHMEAAAASQGRHLEDLSLEEMEALWQGAKDACRQG